MASSEFWPETVAISAGQLRGEADGEAVSWKGIPFAQPPVAELRWKAPRDVKPWQGIRDATSFAPAPWLAGGRDVSEDCLYLNVWRPAHRRSGLPVYVWLPGGGNQTQMPLLSQTSGAYLARTSDVVFVTVPYRLNNLGWLTHPALRSGVNALDDSGNYGTLDIIKALRWIQDNIESFGGDPGNVLVTGESAGAYNTITLFISPEARGLYHKAMAQSGRQDHTTMDRADDRGERLLLAMLTAEHGSDLAAAKALANMNATEIAAFLRSRTPEQLASARGVPFLAGYRDGAVLHEKGFDALDDGGYPNKVTAIIGMNQEESKFQLQRNRELQADRELYEAIAREGSDRKRATGCDALLRRLRNNADQPDVYGYLFRWGWAGGDHPSPLPEPASWIIGAPHGADISFFLHGARGVRGSYTAENESGRVALAQAMAGYVKNFCHTGVPAVPSPDLPAWEPWSNEPGGPKLIEFDADHERVLVRQGHEELTTDDVDTWRASLPQELLARMAEVRATTTTRRRATT